MIHNHPPNHFQMCPSRFAFVHAVIPSFCISIVFKATEFSAVDVHQSTVISTAVTTAVQVLSEVLPLSAFVLSFYFPFLFKKVHYTP
jgi:hypothetical protein